MRGATARWRRPHDDHDNGDTDHDHDGADDDHDGADYDNGDTDHDHDGADHDHDNDGAACRGHVDFGVDGLGQWLDGRRFTQGFGRPGR
ncbi:MAG TPA: hypothetical protein VE466_10675 [Acidimicrobiales bacterium]|nr:hypothetical protein [Acidimicrobiales bacterium]